MLEGNVEHSFRDRGTRRQASEGSCFQNGELSGDGLKRCCGGRVLEGNVEHSFRDRGTRKQASEGSCFQNGELSGDGLKRCCGGRERDRGSVLYDEWYAKVLYKVCIGVCRL